MTSEREGKEPRSEPKPSAGTPAAPPAIEGGEEDRDWVEVRESWVGDAPVETVVVEAYAGLITPPPPAVAPDDPPAPEAAVLPPVARPRTFPPPLPASVRPLPGPRGDLYAAYAIAAARPPEPSSVMLERLAASDYEGALRAAERALRAAPGDDEAQQCRELSRRELRKVYLARLGDATSVPVVALEAAALRDVDVDLRAGLVLSRVDGATSVEAIALSGVVSEIDGLRILSELYLSGVITLQRP